MGLLAILGKQETSVQADRAKEAVAVVRQSGEELERAVNRLDAAVRSNIENTINRTLAEHRRVTGRPRRYDPND